MYVAQRFYEAWTQHNNTNVCYTGKIFNVFICDNTGKSLYFPLILYITCFHKHRFMSWHLFTCALRGLASWTVFLGQHPGFDRVSDQTHLTFHHRANWSSKSQKSIHNIHRLHNWLSFLCMFEGFVFFWELLSMQSSQLHAGGTQILPQMLLHTWLLFGVFYFIIIILLLTISITYFV